jgi:hypothetical protein
LSVFGFRFLVLGCSFWFWFVVRCGFVVRFGFLVGFWFDSCQSRTPQPITKNQQLKLKTGNQKQTENREPKQTENREPKTQTENRKPKTKNEHVFSRLIEHSSD